MKYFLTGGGGFLGSEVVRLLSSQGHECVVLVRNPERAARISHLPGVTLHLGDILDKESMREGMRGCDGLYHMAAWFKIGVGPKERALAYPTNVNGTRNVLELMKELGIKKGVYTSTLAINSDTHGEMVDEEYRFDGWHLTEYDKTKWEAHYKVAEPMIKEGLPLVIVMPGVIYGPNDLGPIHDAFVDFLHRRLKVTPLKTAYCWAHVEDVAQGHLLAMEKGRIGESYILAGERASMIGVFRLAQKITGVRAPTVHPCPPLMLAISGVLTPVSALMDLPPANHPEMVRAVAGVTYLGTNEKAVEELGYAPRPINIGLRQYLEYEVKMQGMELPPKEPAEASTTPAAPPVPAAVEST
eukprot:TRINITY_DN1824_c0_g2_i1.p1 TRINITY_DN1824_c0_g2~~TRINITY_DN1824_c0_g2_i1.p1  ORF type:complete len:356 (+),score=59.05 TRINITY_DN1824_c0_g2_i1:466-1533(+)